MTTAPLADVAIIGGSGFYDPGAPSEGVTIETPWSPVPLRVAELEGRPVAFLARHGADHSVPPHRIDNRANLWALRSVGVTQVIASFACGSLVPAWGPGTIVVPDQLIDRTHGRPDTFHDTFDDGPVHAAFADPYDPDVRSAILAAAPAAGVAVEDGATVVVINGPRFATRAESRGYRQLGADLINMTQYPESVLARELGLAYGAVGLVTDHDAGVDERADIASVTQEAVFEEFARHLPRLRDLIVTTAASV